MPDMLIRDVDKQVLERLRARAKRHGRSLQAELLQILQQAGQSEDKTPAQLAAEIRRRLAGTPQSDSTKLIARDRRR